MRQKFDGRNFDINTQGGKYWCEDCKRFVTNNKASRKHHDTGEFHLENRKKRIENISKNQSIEKRENDKIAAELRRISYEAEKEYENDLKGGWVAYNQEYENGWVAYNPNPKQVVVVKPGPLNSTPQAYDYIPFEEVEAAREKEARKKRKFGIKEEVYDPDVGTVEVVVKLTYEQKFEQFDWANCEEWQKYKSNITIPPSGDYKTILATYQKSWFPGYLEREEKRKNNETIEQIENEIKKEEIGEGNKEEKEKIEEIKIENNKVKEKPKNTLNINFSAPSRILPKIENDTLGVAGEWEEVVDTNSTYYTDYYKPSRPVEPINSGMKFKFNSTNNTNNEGESGGPELEDDDGYGVMSDHVINQISHEKEMQPDKFQVMKLGRLNNNNNNDGTFKKRKLNKSQGRKAVTTKDDL